MLRRLQSACLRQSSELEMSLLADDSFRVRNHELTAWRQSSMYELLVCAIRLAVVSATPADQSNTAFISSHFVQHPFSCRTRTWPPARAHAHTHAHMDRTLKFMRKHAPGLPVIHWLPKYSREDLLGDVVAGITLGLMVVPQGLPFAIAHPPHVV
jgi:hypothetical protein